MRFAPLLVLTAVVLAGCASPAPPGSDVPQPNDAPVLGQGTVLQKGDDPAQFCLGGVMESYPPQCSGPELVGWNWDAVEGEESANGVTWGAYAVWGTWNGTSLTVTESIMFALFDPMPVDDPFLHEANAGGSDESTLLGIQDGIADDAPVQVLSSYPQNGYLFVTVLYDDGAVQAWADRTYGTDVVQVRSALAATD